MPQGGGIADKKWAARAARVGLERCMRIISRRILVVRRRRPLLVYLRPDQATEGGALPWSVPQSSIWARSSDS